MKIALFTTATLAVALLGGSAYAQDQKMPKPPTPGSVTGDWNGAHAPSDDKQYSEKVVVPVGAAPSDTVAAPPIDSVSTSVDTTAPTDAAPAATSYAQAASVTTTTVTNGPVADTPENRAKYGSPMSRAGKRTTPKGN
ncbi:MAG: hypothetical protein KKE02_05530 [Alphaproteobacteria bacterium]|nr:hypothetical protein [Alphaproteobacteria bacterium]MBU1513896.1 hypothetical protein [Alphaproteobacteria bacterium]MBU2094162.1 hypothetical protein [Alphaproteobacteria bacterium]MBU2150460.1 hypothetical protein [Alphaproteobacteria bacterium]MBU2307652.1 hypothetical protein [Alphaproteobacteria bacterium]